MSTIPSSLPAPATPVPVSGVTGSCISYNEVLATPYSESSFSKVARVFENVLLWSGLATLAVGAAAYVGPSFLQSLRAEQLLNEQLLHSPALLKKALGLGVHTAQQVLSSNPTVKIGAI